MVLFWADTGLVFFYILLGEKMVALIINIIHTTTTRRYKRNVIVSLETVPAVWGVQRPDSGTRAAYTQALAKEP